MAKIIRFTSYKREHFTKGEKMDKRFLVEFRKKSKNIEDMPERAQEFLEFILMGIAFYDIPIVQILTKLEIKIFQSKLEPRGLSAYIAVNPDYDDIFHSNKITCVNINESIGHKRFALAHELAHYLFDFNDEKDLTYYNTYFPKEEEDKLEEKRANAFAANLLMPEDIFRRKFEEYKKLQSKSDIVSALGRYFLVSPTAVIKRFKELEIEGYNNT